MLKKYLLLGFLPFYLNAQSIDNIVSGALEKNSTLKALENSIDIAKQEIALASKWDNPVISFGANDVQFNDYYVRDKEAMQAQFIGVSQAIPLGDRLDIAKKVAQDDYSISKYNLENSKLELTSNIYEYSYKIKLLEERLELYNKFKKNVKKIESLLVNFYKYGKAKQKDILNAQILYNELDLKSQQLKTFLDTSYLKLQELTYEKFGNLDIDTNMRKVVLSKDISNHPKILSFSQNSKKYSNISDLEKEKKIPDLKMSVSYFERSSNFEDYMNVSFSFPLAIYGKENIKAAKAKFQSQQVENQLEDLKIKFLSSIDTLQKNIDDSITTYNIIEKRILPKYSQLQKILENDNSYLKSNIDTSSLIQNENEIIKYKLKAVDEKEKYFTALAKSHYFTRNNK